MTWQALCDAYMQKNPKVKCQVELKPSEGYQDWIRTQFAGGEPRPSLVNGNVVADLLTAKKFVNLDDYLDKPNPYNAGKPWRESFDQDVMFLSRDATTGELYHLSLEMVKIIWFYNKDIAAKLYITENTVKNHLRNILEKLHLENRVQAAAYAVREGIIKPAE